MTDDHHKSNLSFIGEEAVARAIYAAGETSFPDAGGPVPWDRAKPSDQWCARILARAAMSAHLAALKEAGLLREEWQSIDSAPRDFTPVLVVGIGADDSPMIVKVFWACAKHVFSSKHQCSRRPSEDCEFRWLGEMGTRYGVEFTHWQPLPAPPAQNGDDDLPR